MPSFLSLQLLEWWETLSKSQLQTWWEAAAAVLPKQGKAPVHPGNPINTGTPPPGLQSSPWDWEQQSCREKQHWKCSGNARTSHYWTSNLYTAMDWKIFQFQNGQTAQKAPGQNFPGASKYLQFYQWALMKRLLEMYFFDKLWLSCNSSLEKTKLWVSKTKMKFQLL